MYFLGGFERQSLLHREYAVVMCIAAMPVEALIHEILVDDRLARRPQHYSNLLKNELAALQNVSLVVFENFASILEGSAVIARELASRCWLSAQTSAAYVDRHIFWELRQMPWPFASGDIEDNLIKLRDGGEQQHPVASKLRRSKTRVVVFGLLRNVESVAAFPRALAIGRCCGAARHGL